jgi:hypothetical protein
MQCVLELGEVAFVPMIKASVSGFDGLGIIFWMSGFAGNLIAWY